MTAPAAPALLTSPRPEDVVSRDAMADPGSLDASVEHAQTRAAGAT